MGILLNEGVGLFVLAVGILFTTLALLRRFGVSSFPGSSRMRNLPGALPLGAGMFVSGVLLVTNASRFWRLVLDPVAICLFAVALVLQSKASMNRQMGN